MAGRPPPPSSKAPVSRETVEVVRKKISAPAGPPPAGMTLNFSAPKAVTQQQRRPSHSREEDVDDSFEQYDEDQGNNQRYHRTAPQQSNRNNRQSSRQEDYDDYDRNRDYRDDYNDYNEDRSRNRNQSRNYERYEENNHDTRDHRYDRQAESKRREEADGYDYRRDDRYDNRKGPSSSNDRRREDESYDDRRDEYSGEEDDGDGDYDDHEDIERERGYEQDAEGRRVKPTGGDSQPNSPDSKPPGRASSDGAKDTHSTTLAPPSTQGQMKKPVIYSFQRLLTSTYRELKSFVMNPAPPGTIVRCYIERNRTGTLLVTPFYSLCADLEDGTGRELMVCKKILKSRTAHYVFSLKSEDLYRKREQRSRLYLGKLRATSNNEYVLYDNGICAAPDDPDSLLEALDDDHEDVRNNAVAKKMQRDREAKESQAKGTSDDVSLYRRELAVIHFNTKHRPTNGVRGMEVCVPLDPATDSANVDKDGKNQGSHVFNIVKPFERIRLAGKQNAMFSKTCLVMHEKLSRYDPLSSCLVDFKGRAHMASVKNFQLAVSDPLANYPVNTSLAHESLVKHDAEAEFMLQMGKTTDDCFNMDYRAPLSLLQCFAICIARFDAHLTW